MRPGIYITDNLLNNKFCHNLRHEFKIFMSLFLIISVILQHQELLLQLVTSLEYF